MSLASRSPVEPSFCPAAAIAASIRSTCARDAARGLGAGAAEAVAGGGELRLHRLDLVAQRALDEAAGLGQPLVGGDEDGLGLVDLAVERFGDGAPGAFQPVAGGRRARLCASCSCALMARATVCPVWPRCSITALERASSAVLTISAARSMRPVVLSAWLATSSTISSARLPSRWTSASPSTVTAL